MLAPWRRLAAGRRGRRGGGVLQAAVTVGEGGDVMGGGGEGVGRVRVLLAAGAAG